MISSRTTTGGFVSGKPAPNAAACAIPISSSQWWLEQAATIFLPSVVIDIKRIGIITGLFDRKSEYRMRSVACLFYERVEL
jgi:hypothetical protein